LKYKITSARPTPCTCGALPQLPSGQSLGIALGIPTMPNLHDVGGYKTRNGAIVARGLAYRSDTFNPMTIEDITKLERPSLKNDYDLRTNDYTLPQFKHVIDDFVAAGGDRAIAVAVFGIKPEYLEASFDEVQKHYGTIECYFSEALGIDAAGQKALHDLYLGTK